MIVSRCLCEISLTSPSLPKLKNIQCNFTCCGSSGGGLVSNSCLTLL